MTDTKSCNGGNCSPKPTSDSLVVTPSMSSTLTAPALCSLCRKFSDQITDTLDLLLALERASIFTSPALSAQEIEQVCSGGNSIIAALADTWSRHLVSTHQGERINGTMVARQTSRFQWSLKLSERSSYDLRPVNSVLWESHGAGCTVKTRRSY